MHSGPTFLRTVLLPQTFSSMWNLKREMSAVWRNVTRKIARQNQVCTPLRGNLFFVIESKKKKSEILISKPFFEGKGWRG